MFNKKAHEKVFQDGLKKMEEQAVSSAILIYNGGSTTAAVFIGDKIQCLGLLHFLRVRIEKIIENDDDSGGGNK